MENQDQINLLWAPRIPNRTTPLDNIQTHTNIISLHNGLDDSFALDEEDDDDHFYVNNSSESEDEFILSSQKLFCDYIAKCQRENEVLKKNSKLRA